MFFFPQKTFQISVTQILVRPDIFIISFNLESNNNIPIQTTSRFYAILLTPAPNNVKEYQMFFSNQNFNVTVYLNYKNNSYSSIIELPMTGNYNYTIFEVDSTLNTNKTLIQVSHGVIFCIRKSSLHSGSFLQCYYSRDLCKVCNLSNIYIQNDKLLFIANNTNIISQPDINTSSLLIHPKYQHMMWPLMISSKPKNVIYMKNLAIYDANLGDFMKNYWHLQTQHLFPLFALFDSYNILDIKKDVILGTPGLAYNQQLKCFNVSNIISLTERSTIQNIFKNYKNYQNKENLTIFYPKIMVGYPFPLDGYHSLFANNRLEKWKQIHKKCYGISEAPPKEHKIVFLNCPSHTKRRVTNPEEVLQALRQNISGWNIDVFDFKDFSHKQQVEIMSQAQILIFPHGAAAANIWFLTKGSLVVEIVPYLFSEFRNYSDFSEWNGMKYYSLNLSKNSCNARRPDMINQLEKKRHLYSKLPYRANARDQSMTLNSTEINMLISFVKSYTH